MPVRQMSHLMEMSLQKKTEALRKKKEELRLKSEQ